MKQTKPIANLLGLALGMLALAGTPAWGQSDAKNKSVALNISNYINVTFTVSGTPASLPLTIAVNDGGAALTYPSANQVNFQVVANSSYAITGGGEDASVPGFSGPTGSTLKIFNWTPPGSMAAGTTNGSFKVRLTLSAAYTNATPGTYSGGTVALTFTTN